MAVGIPSPRVQRGEDTGIVNTCARDDVSVRFRAIYPIWVKPPFLASLKLPQREEPIDIGVQEKHEGITKRGVGIANGAADIAVRTVVGLLEPTPHFGEGLGLDNLIV